MRWCSVVWCCPSCLWFVALNSFCCICVLQNHCTQYNHICMQSIHLENPHGRMFLYVYCGMFDMVKTHYNLYAYIYSIYCYLCWIISYAFTPKAQMNMRAYAAAVEQSHILSHSRCTYFYIG